MSILEASRINTLKSVILNPEQRRFSLHNLKIIDLEWKGRPYLYALNGLAAILMGFLTVETSIEYTPGKTTYVNKETHLDTPTPEATSTAPPYKTPKPSDQAVEITHINGTPVAKPTIQDVITRSDGSQIIITIQPKN